MFQSRLFLVSRVVAWWAIPVATNRLNVPIPSNMQCGAYSRGWAHLATYNARSETVTEKPSYRDAWRKGYRCIIPADAFFEPDWRSGKAVSTRICGVDGEPLGLAGLWSSWKSPKGEWIHSYTMLTINADDHPLMHMFHKPTDEKRMVVILPPDRYQDWLEAPVEHSMDFMRPYPAEALRTTQSTSPRETRLS